MSRNTISTNPARLFKAALFAFSTALTTSTATAQDAVVRSNGFELRPYVGAYIPTGDQRDLLKDAVLVGGQASYRINPQIALTGTLGWSPSEDRITPGNETLDVWSYDLGAEFRAPSWFTSGALDFTPFIGLGAGGRTYNYRDLDVNSKTNFAGFGTLGGELGFGRFGLRLEARDYVSQFKPFDGGDSKTRNDVTIATGLTLRF
jgi:outer membrane protein with beta-barrel domain